MLVPNRVGAGRRIRTYDNGVCFPPFQSRVRLPLRQTCIYDGAPVRADKPSQQNFYCRPLSDLWCQNLVSIQALNAYEASMGADPFGKLRPRHFNQRTSFLF